MTRAFPFILIVLFASALYVLYEPPQRQRPSRQPTSLAAPAAVEEDRLGSPETAPSIPNTARRTPTEIQVAQEEPSAEETPAPYAPRALSLGRHKLSIIDGSARLEVGLSLQVTSRAAERQVRGLRRRILQMTYFLSSRRRAEGMRGYGGLERFRNDLEERVRNLVRSEGLERISLIEPRWIEEPSAESGK